MATSIALVGEPATGKSHSRINLDPKTTAVFAPSAKNPKIKGLKRLKFLSSKGSAKDYDAWAAPQLGPKPFRYKYANLLFKQIAANPKAVFPKITGSYMVIKELEYVLSNMKMVDEHMPHIKVLIFPDFTHFISTILSSDAFRGQSAGGKAFERFWSLAADLLNTFFNSIFEMRDDLTVVIEFHSEFDEKTLEYSIFTCAGKMLKEKFLPDSYFDNLFYTSPEYDEEGNVINWRFIVNHHNGFKGRNDLGITENWVPNDLAPIITQIQQQQLDLD